MKEIQFKIYRYSLKMQLLFVNKVYFLLFEITTSIFFLKKYKKGNNDYFLGIIYLKPILLLFP